MPKKRVGKGPMDAALDYLAIKARSIREMELYLDRMEFGEFEVYSTVERLKELGYLDDQKYAKDFIASRLATKPVSKRKLQEQLTAHAVDRQAIEGALREIPEDAEADNAMQTAEKYCRQFEGLPERERKDKVYRRLLARGYGYDTIRSCLAGLFGDTYTEEE